MTDERTADLAANLAGVEQRIARACEVAGRPRADVTLIVVTKTWPSADVRRLASLGVGDVGENRDQDAAAKAHDCADLDLRWHFVGQLQTNKCRSVAQYATVVHSVDRPALVDALAGAARRAGRVVTALVQVDLDPSSGTGAPGRGGVRPAEAVDLAGLIAGSEGLDLGGVMAIAPVDDDPVVAFGRLAEVVSMVRTAHPGARIVSAGMSGDLEAAVAAGATHVRVGTAVLGTRPPLG